MSYQYFRNGKIIEFDFELTENYYNVGSTYSDYINGKYVKLSEDLIEFKNNNPEASVNEVWNMKLNTPKEEENISSVKLDKSKEVREYYYTTVEKFLLNDKEVWVGLQDRMKSLYIINIEEASGRVVTNLYILGNKYKMTTEKAKELLYQLELYSIDNEEILNSKLQEIEASNDLEYIKNYDIANGYLERISFTV